MRNVNVTLKLQELPTVLGFILTMRNVNTARDFLEQEKDFCFILTMRNVNEKKKESDLLQEKVLY